MAGGRSSGGAVFRGEVMVFSRSRRQGVGGVSSPGSFMLCLIVFYAYCM